MPRLIIANVDAAAMAGAGRDQSDYANSVVTSQRLLWLMRPGDVIVLPEQPPEPLLDHMRDVLGWAPESRDVVVPAGSGIDGLIWSDPVLNNDDVRQSLNRRLGEETDWQLVAYFLDRASLRLATSVGIADVASSAFLIQRGAEALNSKVTFREIAAALGTPVPPGEVVTDGDELRAAVTELIGTTGHVIVKQDVNLGGCGNTVLTTSSQESFAGSRRTIRLSESTDLAAVCGDLWHDISVGINNRAVVEEYHPAAEILYSEIRIDDALKTPRLLDYGKMRMEPVFVGFEIPSPTLGSDDAARMAVHSVELSRACAARGFTGYLNIDSIVTEDGHVLFSEINGRMGACTHIDVLARSLLGKDYMRRHTLLSRNRVPVADLTVALKNLAAEGLLFDQSSRTGVVLLAASSTGRGEVEYLVVGSTHEQVGATEARVLSVLTEEVSSV